MIKIKVIIKRKYEELATFGKLELWVKFIDTNKSILFFECDSLELPYKENKRFISSIKKGVYPIRIENKKIWVDNVPDRDFIQIHVANTIKDLEGCIGVGKRYENGLINSRITLKCFFEILEFFKEYEKILLIRD